jgi:tetratricopeptide (TPR) repeat protein
VGSPALGDLSKVGTVQFPTSCDPAVQKQFERAVALMHSFFYEEARREFNEVAAKDPECAMAYWGIAMTHYHPIWTAPDEKELASGQAAVDKALAASKKNERERQYIGAIEAYYKGLDVPQPQEPAAPSCHGPGPDPRGRAACFRREMEKVAAEDPEDVEAAAFYALSLLGTAPPGDPALANQKQSAEILEQWFGRRKDHPGLAHYLIHSYDYPPLAEKGLSAANVYAAMAPGVPHALHMPSHIYTRLGMWQQTIDSNLASAEAARQYAAKYHPDAASFEELHALDYLMYGYLQTEQDAKARAIVEHLGTIRKTHPETDFAVAYAVGAIPARHALERRQWKEAASIQAEGIPFLKDLPFGEGLRTYAQAVGAVRSGDLEAASRAAERLEELAAASVDPRFRYFADQMELQRQAAQGLIALAKGQKQEAIGLLQAAAEQEDRLGKHPVSPGAILPIREILGETLLECDKPAEALAAFEATLKIYPARFNGLVGAARAADRAGKKEAARRYYAQLLEQTKAGDGKRADLAEAQAYVKGA